MSRRRSWGTVTDMTTGRVRKWHAADGWGVIDSPETPGGCWAHFSVIVMDGYRSLHDGDTVEFVYESATQDGYTFRALRVWSPCADGSSGPPATPHHGPSSAYQSR